MLIVWCVLCCVELAIALDRLLAGVWRPSGSSVYRPIRLFRSELAVAAGVLVVRCYCWRGDMLLLGDGVAIPTDRIANSDSESHSFLFSALLFSSLLFSLRAAPRRVALEGSTLADCDCSTSS